MKMHTTLEIDEIETEVVIDFAKDRDGEIEIDNICDAHTGIMICPCPTPDSLFEELYEYYADEMAERSVGAKRRLRYA